MKLGKYCYGRVCKNRSSATSISGQQTRKFLRGASYSFCLVGVILCLVSSLLGQVDRSGLNGTVTDPSGRFLPQAHVTAVHNATGLQRETTTTARGTYDIPELPIGVYTITFSHEGFKTLSFTNVVQAIQLTRTLNAILPVSGDQERVEVSASTEQLNETSNTLGARVEHAQAEVISVPCGLPGEAATTTISPMTALTPRTSSTRASKPMFGSQFLSAPSRSFALAQCWRRLRREEREADN
jgi:hypothetical protein